MYNMWFLIALLAAPAFGLDKSNCTATDTLLCRSSYYDTCYISANNSTRQCFCAYTETYVDVDSSMVDQCKQAGVIGGAVNSLFGQVSTTMIITIFGLVFSFVSLVLQFCLFRKQIAQQSTAAYMAIKSAVRRKKQPKALF